MSYAVDSRTETRDLLWTVDSVARLAEAQLMGAQRDATPPSFGPSSPSASLFIPARCGGPSTGTPHANRPSGFRSRRRLRVRPGSPSTACGRADRRIDKADPAIPNGLLDAFGHGRFDVPGCPPVRMSRAQRPLVVITTNEEQACPTPFCVAAWCCH